MDLENMDSKSEDQFAYHAIYITFAALAAFFLVIVALLKIYNKVTSGKCRSYKAMSYKTVIVTGANSGLGRETALNMALRGARVILACRDLEKGRVTAEEITKRTGNSDISVVHLDISSLFSIRQFAEKINRDESRLDVLINNAGVAALNQRHLSPDNVEITFATNYLGPFLLTHLLLDLLKKSSPSRIVNISSLLHILGKIEFGNLNGEVDYSPYHSYCNSKLALNLFTKELAVRLQKSNEDVTVNAVHPGIANTNIWRNFHPFVRFFIKTGTWMFFKNPLEGAQTAIYLAVADEVQGISGEYFSDCKKKSVSAKSKDMNVAKRLYEVSEKWCEQSQTISTV